MGPDGHYHLTLRLDGTPVHFVVDTGASNVVLTARGRGPHRHRPRRPPVRGLRPHREGGTVQTARGRHRAKSRSAAGRTAIFPSSSIPGEMDLSLLGMDYLSRFERIEIADGRLVLER